MEACVVVWFICLWKLEKQVALCPHYLGMQKFTPNTSQVWMDHKNFFQDLRVSKGDKISITLNIRLGAASSPTPNHHTPPPPQPPLASFSLCLTSSSLISCSNSWHLPLKTWETSCIVSVLWYGLVILINSLLRYNSTMHMSQDITRNLVRVHARWLLPSFDFSLNCTSISNWKFERLVGPLDEIVTISVHNYNVICEIMTSFALREELPRLWLLFIPVSKVFPV